MFQVIKYQSDQVTGKIEVRICLQIKRTGNIVDTGGTFYSDVSAKNWLRKEKTGYFLCKMENYLVHKKQIIDNAPFRNKSMNPKEAALVECFNYFRHATEKQDLREACKWALSIQSKLELILPSEKNASFENSKKDLAELLDFARDHAEGAILKQAC